MEGRHFLHFFLMVGLCFFCLAAQGQDTGKAPVRSPAHQPVSPKKDTAPKKNVAAPARKDTGKAKKDTLKPKPGRTAAKRDTITDSSAAMVPPPTSRHPASDSGRRVVSRTPVAAADTVKKPTLALPAFTRDSFGNYGAFVRYLTAHNAIFSPSDTVTPDITSLRNERQTTQVRLYSGIFYIILGVLFLLAILRIAFTKYFTDLFRAFFNPTLSQRQLRDQLSQTPFPSLMLNLFFSISAGLYLFLVLLHYHYFVLSRPLLLIPVLIGLIMVIYLFKYLFLRFAGWLFGYQDTASGYAFTLYMVNKVLGIALLPFILILAFSPRDIAGVALDISLILIVLLFIYRYIRIYGMARNQIFFQKFHFFVYLCGFEIAPILIVGKLVLIWLNGA